MKPYLVVVSMIEINKNFFGGSLCDFLQFYITKTNKMRYIFLIFITILFFQCQPAEKEWTYNRTIDLGTVTPIGLTQLGEHLWIADGDHNQLVHIDKTGKVLKTYDGFERPMHLDADGDQLYVPEYGKDQITIFSPDKIAVVEIQDSLDAPAGVDIFELEIAIADFYNHRVLYKNADNWISIGKKGKVDGDFHYPTDVQITSNKIYVADAYNNRIQVFDKSGKHLLTFGETEKMNAATGIYVSDQQVFVTDFENDRVLIYDLAGVLQQTLNTGLEKPTDILQVDNEIWVANYKGKDIRIYQ